MDTLERELVSLRAEIARAFKDVHGPPPVTQSMARVVDDNGNGADFKRALREQQHHAHWNRVTTKEIEVYHDVWPWIDDVAFQFYIPAYMTHALDGFIDTEVVRVREPDWMRDWGAEAPRNIGVLTLPQKTCLQKFLKLVADANLGARDSLCFGREAYLKWRTALT